MLNYLRFLYLFIYSEESVPVAMEKKLATWHVCGNAEAEEEEEDANSGNAMDQEQTDAIPEVYEDDSDDYGREQ
jgi:hypothetical protein